LLGRHRLRAPDPAAARLSASLHAVVVGPVTMAYLQVSAVTELEVAGTAPRFLVATPGDASPPVESGSASLDASRSTAAVLQPGRPRTLLLPAGSTTLLVGIERAAVLVHLSRLLGRIPRHPLAFDPELDLMAGTASRWNLAVAMLHAELEERGSLLRAGIGQGHLEEFLMSALLYGHPSSYSEALAEPERAARHPATRAARDFIELNLSERLTVASVASAAGVSPRTLQAAFRSEMRTTPTAYIRGRRLDQVRADLAEAAVGGGSTVTGVATRWGITHLGRFASEYRKRFGESPSQTLRRAEGDGWSGPGAVSGQGGAGR